MSLPIEVALTVALACALVAVVFGQVLTRSIIAGHAALAALGLACLVAGGGVLALCFVIIGLLWLAILQLFGWMLVDVDHDHLAALSWRTAGARVTALATFAAGLAWLGHSALRRGELDDGVSIDAAEAALDPSVIGALFIGARSELSLLLGLLFAAALLTALCLLRDEGSEVA